MDTDNQWEDLATQAPPTDDDLSQDPNDPELIELRRAAGDPTVPEVTS